MPTNLPLRDPFRPAQAAKGDSARIAMLLLVCALLTFCAALASPRTILNAIV